MHNQNWDDLRFLLAVAEAGSVNAAAGRLKVNHATVLRRIKAFEARYGIEVFDRSARGYRTNLVGQRLIAAAKAVEQAHQALERLISGQDNAYRGSVRLTSTDTFSSTVLPGMLARFRQLQPLINVELQTTNTHVSLSRLDADLTVRPALALPDNLRGIRAATLGFAIYGRRNLIARLRGGDRSLPWLMTGAQLQESPPGRWMTENIPQQQVVALADSFLTLAHMAVAGLGLVLLPCCLAIERDELVRLNDQGPAMTVEIWVAAHADMAEVPRIRETQRFLAAELAAQKKFLLGNY